MHSRRPGRPRLTVPGKRPRRNGRAAVPPAHSLAGGAGPGVVATTRHPRRGGWRGMPEDKQDEAGGRPNWSRFWLILLGLLVLNWILGSLLTGAVRPTVSYTFFLGQVNANNVKTVTSTGDAIQGTFRHQVAYPPGSSGGRQVVQFTTQRPAFAN